jgi:LuxR family transcriptional regulator, regulator of acetate metabolism
MAPMVATAESTAALGLLRDLPSAASGSSYGLRDLVDAERRLHGCRSVSELFGMASDLAREWCGFSRAVVISVADQMLTATTSAALSDPGSDALRRHLLAHPVPLLPGTVESEFIRQCGSIGARQRRAMDSPLQAAVGLDQFALGAIMPETQILALLVVDRPSPLVDRDARDAVLAFSHILARGVERLFLRQRMTESADEMRHLTTSVQALVRENLDSPIALPSDNGSGPVFALTFPAVPASDELWRIFTRRELDILPHMVAGLSNRDIAAELHLSPHTVKKYVARVLLKLGAVNRADAAVKYVHLAGDERRLNNV